MKRGEINWIIFRVFVIWFWVVLDKKFRVLYDIIYYML